jgi:flagellar assembly protein FliH
LSEDYDLKQYEIKPFDSFPVGRKKENMVVFALPQEGGMKKSVFNLVDCSGNFLKFEGPDDIMEKASEKASMLEREAYEKGFAQGEKDGLELGAAKALKVVENMETLLNEIGCLRTDIIKLHEKDIIGLICAVAEKVVHHEVALNGMTSRETVIRAIQLATEKRSILLRVNPEEFDYIEQLKPELFKRFNELTSIEVVSSQSVKRGGCFLETQYGDVDARVETQMEMIRQSLEEAYKGNGDD